MLPGSGGWPALPEVAEGGSRHQRSQTRLRLDRHMDDRTVSFPIVRVTPSTRGLYMAYLSEKLGGWLRRLTVATIAAAALPGLIGLVGDAPTAGAFSRP